MERTCGEKNSRMTKAAGHNHCPEKPRNERFGKLA